MANELRECPNPWCGWTEGPHIVVVSVCFHVPFQVRCICGVIGPDRPTRDAAIAAWNTRPQSPAFVAMKDALREILEHVEDMQVDRVGSQCTLCHTFRMLGHAALKLAQKEAAE